jgi:hypothetical protein
MDTVPKNSRFQIQNAENAGFRLFFESGIWDLESLSSHGNGE